MIDKLDIITKGDERMEDYCEDEMMHGEPDMVVIARDEHEVAEVLAHCYGNDIPVTFCASQTSMTGASVANGGMLVSTERLEGMVDIEEGDGRAHVTVRPGTITADLQKAVAEAGWFFPVGPTSRDECRIGANVITNASGEDSYKYGAIRSYVRRLKLTMADGSESVLERTDADRFSVEPARAGYEAEWNNPLDLIVGSEGTIAFVSEVTLDLLPAAQPFYTILVPFALNARAISFVVGTVNEGDHSVRALELIDSGALNAMKTAEGFPQLPEDVAALVYVKQEYDDDVSMQRSLEKWRGEFAEMMLVAKTDDQKEEFRLWRHRIPEWANEQGKSHWDAGGGKVGSDWWVPVAKLEEMMAYFYSLAEKTCLRHMAYAHVGRGHPHTNLLAEDGDQLQAAHDVLERCCRKAVSLGGGVAGEHGLGKLHTDLLAIQHPPEVIEQMKRWKTEYDPKWILGKGNIFQI